MAGNHRNIPGGGCPISPPAETQMIPAGTPKKVALQR
jgi:hypothetical protein